MYSNFEFNAPQYINFSAADDSTVDKFFDMNVPQKKEANIGVSSTKKKLGCGFKDVDLENKDPCLLAKGNLSSCKKTFPVLKKVLHEIVNQQIQNDIKVDPKPKNEGKDLIEDFEKLQLSESKPRKSRLPVKATEPLSGIQNRGSARKSHPMITRLDAMYLNKECIASGKQLNFEDVSQATSVNQVSSSTGNGIKSNGNAIKRVASPLQSAKKFISLAEQVEHFYKDTPDRYRSKPSKLPTPNWTSRPKCIPKTPNLTTKYRCRKIDFPNREQREEIELEQIKKHQIKAHPLNEKILKAPALNLKVPIIKKPITVPQPFSLTEVKKKEPLQEPVFQFKAQPVPSTLLHGPIGIPPKRLATPTRPRTPMIHYSAKSRVEVKSPNVPKNFNMTPCQKTKVEPFSFDTRIKETLQKKEEFIKKVIEEEKKSFNSFKAHPMPSFKNKSDEVNKKAPQKTIPQPFNLYQGKGTKTTSEENIVETAKVPLFKAKPAYVIHQKPFVPKLEMHEVVLPPEFHLNTEKRAAERLKFDEKVKIKEEEMALLMKIQKEEEEKMEIAKMLEDRKKAEFKARPMPHYKVFEIQGGGIDKITFPQSPKLSTKLRVAKKTNHTNDLC